MPTLLKPRCKYCGMVIPGNEHELLVRDGFTVIACPKYPAELAPRVDKTTIITRLEPR